MGLRAPTSTPFPYTTLFRSGRMHPAGIVVASLVIGFLQAGSLAVADLVPKELTEMLLGVVVLAVARSEEHTSELQSQSNLVCRPLLEKKNSCRHGNFAARQA